MPWTGTAESRGYDWEWKKRRARVLARDGNLCQCKHCKAEGRVTYAGEVDHVVSRAEAKRLGWTHERTESDDNLSAIAHDCHVRKSIEERGGTMRERVEIGLDGWPLR